MGHGLIDIVEIKVGNERALVEFDEPLTGGGRVTEELGTGEMPLGFHLVDHRELHTVARGDAHRPHNVPGDGHFLEGGENLAPVNGKPESVGSGGGGVGGVVQAGTNRVTRSHEINSQSKGTNAPKGLVITKNGVSASTQSVVILTGHFTGATCLVTWRDGGVYQTLARIRA